MEWEIVTQPFTKLSVDFNGAVLPLCTTCIQTECSYPIRESQISVFGKVVNVRLFVLNNAVRQVIACSGYIPDQNINKDKDEKQKQ